MTLLEELTGQTYRLEAAITRVLKDLERDSPLQVEGPYIDPSLLEVPVFVTLLARVQIVEPVSDSPMLPPGKWSDNTDWRTETFPVARKVLELWQEYGKSLRVPHRTYEALGNPIVSPSDGPLIATATLRSQGEPECTIFLLVGERRMILRGTTETRMVPNAGYPVPYDILGHQVWLPKGVEANSSDYEAPDDARE
jgi:hypothetical protein